MIALASLFFLGHVASAAEFRSEIEIFGATFHWNALNSETNARMLPLIKQRANVLSQAWDPDCYYRAQGLACTTDPNHKSELKAIKAFALIMKEETQGLFDPYTEKRGKKYLDLGGIAQGFFLETLAQQSRDSWQANFAGDIFVAKNISSPVTFELTDPSDEDGKIFAHVSLKGGGWIFQGSGSKISPEMRHPFQKKWKEDFQKIVLFAPPDFHGGRLDAWDTALIAGGRALLDKLWKDPRFKGKWAYVWIDPTGRSECSPNIVCRLAPQSRREILVNW